LPSWLPLLTALALILLVVVICGMALFFLNRTPRQ
jgi:hypothetical protein